MQDLGVMLDSTNSISFGPGPGIGMHSGINMNSNMNMNNIHNIM